MATKGLWRRLTRKEAVNWFIASLILEGMDPNNELVADGDPGPFLQKAIGNQALDERLDEAWPGMKGSYPKRVISFSGEELHFYNTIFELARNIGYKGKSLRGIIRYMRSLPAEGPIG